MLSHHVLHSQTWMFGAPQRGVCCHLCRVLTMEYLEGVPLTDLAAVSRVTDVRPDEVLINALNTWFLSLTQCPTFHADVHAGALMAHGCRKLALCVGCPGVSNGGIGSESHPCAWCMVVLDGCSAAGNLLVLRDGRIGFIDFGIVGKIPVTTWLALESLATAFQTSNHDLMAR